jgi:hypothetical protein
MSEKPIMVQKMVVEGLSRRFSRPTRKRTADLRQNHPALHYPSQPFKSIMDSLLGINRLQALFSYGPSLVKEANPPSGGTLRGLLG